MTDRRVVRTNQALRAAFRKLAQQYRYHEITVQQLTDEVDQVLERLGTRQPRTA